MTFVCNLVTLSCDFWTQATCVPAVPQSEEDCHLLGGLGLPPTAPTCTRIITEVQGLKIINVHFFTFDFTFEIRIWDAKIKAASKGLRYASSNCPAKLANCL